MRPSRIGEAVQPEPCFLSPESTMVFLNQQQYTYRYGSLLLSAAP